MKYIKKHPKQKQVNNRNWITSKHAIWWTKKR